LKQKKKNELDRHTESFDGFEENETNDLSTPVEKKLYAQFQDEKRRTIQLKQQIDNLFGKMETQSRLEEENHQLKEYCTKLEQENAQQFDEVTEMGASIQNEVIKLAHRNAHLEQEKQELLKDLENKIYELSMLRKSLELSQKDNSIENNNETNETNANAMSDEIYNTQKNELLDAFSLDYENNSDSDIETEQINNSPEKTEKAEKKERKKQAFVPDVLKEYMHLTATAVKIKYPRVNIESADLIEKVKFEPYYNYFERMTQIMQAEEAKSRKPKQNVQIAQNESFFF